MAPVDKPDHNLVEQQIKDIIQSLFQLMVQTSTYDQAGRPTSTILSTELTTLSSSLGRLSRTAVSSLPPPPSSNPHHLPPTNNDPRQPSVKLPEIPEPLIEYVEAGRNPDIYTREFVELVRRMNQLARGKEMAFTKFRDVLAEEMGRAMPELKQDVERVVEATGGREAIRPVVREGGGGGAGGGEGNGEGKS
ncbi:transcription factor subunit Med10 of mediator complex-domain-containing protein [Coniochaeta sp. 2T2.1]|nr:transcription factor subunit Med10 of mediator complex-domain-containing protein [Coniochaeta sp. 2T2.1]